MRDKFGTVDTALWKKREFKTLDDDSKLLFLYLKTCDHQNMIGCFHLPVLYICADLKWSEKKVNETLCKLFDNDFVKVDEGLEMVFLPKHLSKHPLQNPNQAKGAERLFDEISKKYKHIKELANVLLTQSTLTQEFRNRLETLCNSVSVTPTPTATVTPIGAGAPKPPQAAEFDHVKAFDEFWSEYPRKVGKDAAAKKFKSKCGDEATFAEIMVGLRLQIPTWNDPQYIPHPTTWLNAGRWKDELTKNNTDQAIEDFLNGNF